MEYLDVYLYDRKIGILSSDNGKHSRAFLYSKSAFFAFFIEHPPDYLECIGDVRKGSPKNKPIRRHQ